MDSGIRSHFKSQTYLTFKSSSIWLSFTFVVSFLPLFNFPFGFLSTQSCPIFSHQENRLSWDILPDPGVSVSLWTSSLGGHTPQSAPRMTSCPHGPWEVVIKRRLCGKITGGHFSVTPSSANPKMNFNYQQPLSKECNEGLFQERVISNEKLSSKFLVPSYKCFPDICSINLLNISLNNLLK